VATTRSRVASALCCAVALPLNHTTTRDVTSVTSHDDDSMHRCPMRSEQCTAETFTMIDHQNTPTVRVNELRSLTRKFWLTPINVIS